MPEAEAEAEAEPAICVVDDGFLLFVSFIFGGSLSVV